MVLSFAGLGVEAVAGRHHYRLTFVTEVGQAPFAELLGIVHRQFDHDIERPHRRRGKYARNLVELVNQEIAAGQILIINLLHVFLRRGERRFGNHLTDKRWRETGLTELHHGFTHFLILGYQRTNTDAALAVTL